MGIFYLQKTPIILPAFYNMGILPLLPTHNESEGEVIEDELETAHPPPDEGEGDVILVATTTGS